MVAKQQSNKYVATIPRGSSIHPLDSCSTLRNVTIITNMSKAAINQKVILSQITQVVINKSNNIL